MTRTVAQHPRSPDSHPNLLTKSSRLAFIQKAQVWRPTDIPGMNLREGPRGAGSFRPNELVTCDYVERPKSGTTPKFHCALADGEIVKVRYGAHNGEIVGSVIATRLLWALGFAADRVYPVRVRCRGCAPDPWHGGAHGGEVHEFDPAVIERKATGHEMWEGRKPAGWAWKELDLVDEAQGGAPREQRDALRLLAVFMQHSDTHNAQQKLLCLPDGLTAAGDCEKPFMLLHDVGKTFGHSSLFNRMGSSSVNFDAWSQTPIWRNRTDCVGYLSKSYSGTLGDPHISDAGRQFLLALLQQLTDRQLNDLFDVAGVDRQNAPLRAASLHSSVDEWVAAFKSKRDEIATHVCAR